MKTEVSQILKAKRKELGLSVREVVDILRTNGVSVAEKTVYGWESGNRQPDADTFMALCKIYQIHTFPNNENKNAPALSAEALKLAETYDYVDDDGKRLLQVVAAEERKRTDRLRKEARSKRKEGLAPDPGAPARVIPLYLSPAAAGFASPAFGDDFDYIEVGGEVPAFADFAVKIDGDSMEPYIMDGSTVYVNGDPLANGDIGIFFYDGDTFCKQYYRDQNGNVRLLSLNRDRADADRFIPADSSLTLVCHGRVILPTKPRLAIPDLK